ncbi:uncharacterized protein C6orf118 homolog [Discoglossus pictus]
MFKTKQQDKIINLHKLLDDIEIASKNDARDYTSGHLNCKHLSKPTVLSDNIFWKRGQKEIPFEDQKLPRVTNINVRKMKDALTDFTAKTCLEQSKHKASISHSPLVKHVSPTTPKNTPYMGSLLDSQSREMKKQDIRGSLQSEELELPRLKVLTFKEDKNRTKLLECDGEYNFVPTYLGGLTKTDQFVMFSKFDREFLKTEDLTKYFTKNTLVESHEQKLNKELLNISHVRPPHVARIQIFCEAFGNICSSSSIFGNLLGQMKSAYESYIEDLLDTQASTQYEVLPSETGVLKKRAIQTQNVEEAIMKVRNLEQEAKAALDMNERLRNQLKEEIDCNTSQDTVANMDLHWKPEVKELSEKSPTPNNTDLFKSKRCDVLALCNEVQALEQEIRKHMTHAVNASATEQHIKEVQAEIVKLQTSNKFLERASKDFDSEIKRSLNKQKLTLSKQNEIKQLLETFFSM